MITQLTLLGTAAHACTSYVRVLARTAGAVDLYLELHDAVLTSLGHARGGKLDALLRAHALLCQLQATLEPERDPRLCGELNEIYDGMLHRVMRAYASGEVDQLGEVQEGLRSLRTAWLQVAAEACARHSRH